MNNFMRAASCHCGCCQLDKPILQENSCKVLLPKSRKDWVGYSGTLLQKNHGLAGKLADGVIFWDKGGPRGLTFSIELKRHRFDVSGVVEQVQAGADFIDEVMRGHDVIFSPVLVHFKGMPVISLKKLRGRKITFRGRSMKIKVVKSGCQIQDLE